MNRKPIYAYKIIHRTELWGPACGIVFAHNALEAEYKVKKAYKGYADFDNEDDLIIEEADCYADDEYPDVIETNDKFLQKIV